MDYEGQKLCEYLFCIIILAFGSIGWIIGYIHQDFYICVKAWFAGLVLSIIVRKSFSFLMFDIFTLNYVYCLNSCVSPIGHILTDIL